jgi:hypothetical protein
MSKFPVITGPCQYKSRLAELMDGSTCRMCQREVHDLTAMNEPDRRAFLAACEESVCVSYKVPARAALAALAMGAATLATLPAAAQDTPAAAEQAVPEEDYEIFVGAVKDPAKAKWTKAPRQTAPKLPVVYEDDAEGGAAGKGKPAQ